MPTSTTKKNDRLAEATEAIEVETHQAGTAIAEPAAGQEFVGQWNQLISTTNWEKGQIIQQWREALMEADAPASEYADEAWAKLVGGVTSQHVGRLRRVYAKFGENYEQYQGLYWSHFQAGLDWDDSEMWLEGAIQNGWSVSQMRGKRWETVGKPGEKMPEEAAEEIDNGVDVAAEEGAAAGVTPVEKNVAAVDGSSSGSQDAESKASKSNGDSDSDSEDHDSEEAAAGEATTTATKKSRQRLSVDVDELPDDLADAFEAFKLAIISHRRDEWSETNVDTVIECLDALKQLAEAPLD